MKICCIEGCEGPNGKDPVFFEFPTSRLLRKRWMDAISASNLNQDSVICIRHFSRKDYELVRGKTRLKSRVIPTLRVGGKSNESEDSDGSDESTDTAASNLSDFNEAVTQNFKNKNTSNGNVEKNEICKNNKEQSDHAKLTDTDVGERVDPETKLNDTLGKDIKNNDTVDKDNDKVAKITTNTVPDKETNQNISKSTQNDENSKNTSHNKNTHTDTENNRNTSINTETNIKCNRITSDDTENSVNKNNNMDNVKKLQKHNEIDNTTNENLDKIESNSESTKSVEIRNNSQNNNDNKNINNDNRKVHNDNRKVHNDNRKDNEKVNNGKVYRKTRCKIVPNRPGRRRESWSEDSSSGSPEVVRINAPPPSFSDYESKEDIEEILTNYYIENNKTERQVAAMSDVLQEENREVNGERRVVEELRGFKQSEPVFIELSVGSGYPRYPGSHIQGPGENDCLMVLESVQCDVDPELLLAGREDEEVEQVDLAADDDDEEPVEVVKKKEDPISLLTSSDEDEVIIQEPKIDTVEVSSAVTSEDDMPLVKLIKKKTKKKSKNKKSSIITKLLWGGTNLYCVHCRYTAVDSAEYAKHMATHTTEKVLQLCDNCGFTTCSKKQLSRHRQKHKLERKYQCQQCSYTAKHKMSLVYHMKTHPVNDVEIAICGTYEPPSKVRKSGESGRVKGKVRNSGESGRVKGKVKECNKRHKCGHCRYKTDRRSDLKRHLRSLHHIDLD